MTVLFKNLLLDSVCTSKSLKSSVKAARQKYLLHLEILSKEKKKRQILVK